jgi:hypothetical protein
MYAEKTTTTVIYTPVTLSSIGIKTQPTKKEYFVGESLDTKGLVVSATYSNGTVSNITNYTISGFSSAKAGNVKVTITFNGKTTTFNVTIKEKVVTPTPVTPKPVEPTPVTPTPEQDKKPATEVQPQVEPKEEPKVEPVEPFKPDDNEDKKVDTIVNIIIKVLEKLFAKLAEIFSKK